MGFMLTAEVKNLIGLMALGERANACVTHAPGKENKEWVGCFARFTKTGSGQEQSVPSVRQPNRSSNLNVSLFG